ncbi:general stress protein [Pseudonocardia hydrocarbonoxydans]|uniref:General stress protein 17M-like domain-containing protein n=1 Tax=Pseudonocardia hydrocarbonoxydans TaxID=76726 RepID=A0A4Y3WNW2_9PSEU|nr:general stress protein [Pseudonocardia hydrocarbonoxydans]GEC19931.1 hypothetical protein PHY01_22140 [Pseudonocardia hydrocarbonoxydans]
MTEQSIPVADGQPAGRSAVDDAKRPSRTDVARYPARRRIATFDDYREAERAVERLTSRGFPVERAAIVGRDMRWVEQITGRLTLLSATWRGALAGALPGALIGWIFGLFSWVDPLIGALLVALYGLIFGALLGAVMGAVTYALQRGRRDFASVAVLQAQHFDLLVDDAARLLDRGV